MKKFVIFTDGSYFVEDGNTHGGIVFVDPITKNVTTCSHVMSSNRFLGALYNVGGELLAAYSGILSVISLYEKELTAGMELEIEIHHDYEGVSKWYTQEWRDKRTGTHWYVRELQAMKKKYSGLNLKFVWEKGHSGVIANEVADSVAFWNCEYCRIYNIPIINMDAVLNRDPTIGENGLQEK